MDKFELIKKLQSMPCFPVCIFDYKRNFFEADKNVQREIGAGVYHNFKVTVAHDTDEPFIALEFENAFLQDEPAPEQSDISNKPGYIGFLEQYLQIEYDELLRVENTNMGALLQLLEAYDKSNKNTLQKALQLLQDNEDLEAALIMECDWDTPNGYPMFNWLFYKKWLYFQAKRNHLLRPEKWPDEPKESQFMEPGDEKPADIRPINFKTVEGRLLNAAIAMLLKDNQQQSDVLEILEGTALLIEKNGTHLEPVFVRITISIPDVWYTNHVGEVFIVCPNSDRLTLMLWDDYIAKKPVFQSRIINKRHCVQVVPFTKPVAEGGKRTFYKPVEGVRCEFDKGMNVVLAESDPEIEKQPQALNYFNTVKIEGGLKFTSIHFPKGTEVLVDYIQNEKLFAVIIYYPDQNGEGVRQKDWVIEHAINSFKAGEYKVVKQEAEKNKETLEGCPPLRCPKCSTTAVNVVDWKGDRECALCGHTFNIDPAKDPQEQPGTAESNLYYKIPEIKPGLCFINPKYPKAIRIVLSVDKKKNICREAHFIDDVLNIIEPWSFISLQKGFAVGEYVEQVLQLFPGLKFKTARGNNYEIIRVNKEMQTITLEHLESKDAVGTWDANELKKAILDGYYTLIE